MRLRRTIAAIAVVAAGAGAVLQATAKPADATSRVTAPGGDGGQYVTLLNEPFSGPTLDADFKLLGSAGLTNAPDNTKDAPKARTVTGSTYPEVGVRRGAPPSGGRGYLQLTDNNHDKVGAVLYDNALPTAGGLDVTFEMYQFNSTTNTSTYRPADGIGFFIVDGAYKLERAGGFGGSLGYAQKWESGDASKTAPGVKGGYLGIGFDSLGNYITNEWECRGGTINPLNNTCPIPYAESKSNPAYKGMTSWGGDSRNSVTLRGPWKNQNEYSGYEYLISTARNINPGNPTAVPYAPSLLLQSKSLNAQHPTLGQFYDWADNKDKAEALRMDAKRLVRVTVDAKPCTGSAGGTCPLVSVYMDFAPPRTDDIADAARNLGEDKLILRYQMTDPMPPTFKFGFAGSTGAMTDVHLIRTLNVSTLRPVTPKIVLDKEAIVVPTGSNCAPGQGLETAQQSTTPYAENDEVCYRFTVTNDGDIELTNIRITDHLEGVTVTGPALVAVLGTKDEKPGGADTAYFYGTYNVTASDVANKSVTNSATATGEAGSISVTDDSDETVQTAPSLGIRLEKTVAVRGDEKCDASLTFAGSVVAPGPGTPVCYRLRITNTGNAPLAISLEDTVIGFTVPADATRPALQPGSSTDFYRSYTVTGADTTFVNTATVVGTHEGGTVKSTDDAQVIFAVDIPLPQVGGVRDVGGVVALIVSAALTVYILDIRRRQHGKPAR